jgi:hypothetical protein
VKVAPQPSMYHIVRMISEYSDFSGAQSVIVWQPIVGWILCLSVEQKVCFCVRHILVIRITNCKLIHIKIYHFALAIIQLP